MDLPVSLSPWVNIGIAGFVVMAIVLGWLIPKRSVDKLIQILNQLIQDKDDIIAELRKTNDALDQRNDMLADQVRLLTETAKTANAALSALPQPPRKDTS